MCENSYVSHRQSCETPPVSSLAWRVHTGHRGAMASGPALLTPAGGYRGCGGGTAPILGHSVLWCDCPSWATHQPKVSQAWMVKDSGPKCSGSPWRAWVLLPLWLWQSTPGQPTTSTLGLWPKVAVIPELQNLASFGLVQQVENTRICHCVSWAKMEKYLTTVSYLRPYK